jgi:hypothetical protein
LHQLEINLNQINNALRDRNSLNFNILNQALGIALAALARPRIEASNENQASDHFRQHIENVICIRNN